MWERAPLGQAASANTSIIFTNFGKLEKSLHSSQNPNILKNLDGTQEKEISQRIWGLEHGGQCPQPLICPNRTVLPGLSQALGEDKEGLSLSGYAFPYPRATLLKVELITMLS